MITKKEFLTVGEIDLIAKYLDLESWNKFKKISAKNRVRCGLQILRKFKSGGVDSGNLPRYLEVTR